MITAKRNRRANNARSCRRRPAWFIAAALAAIVSAPSSANAQSAGQTAAANTEQLYDTVNGSVCTIVAVATDGSHVSRGSGFVLSGSGLLVTNAHVIAGLQNATAKCGGQQLDIRRIVKFDRDIDLAIGEIGPVDVPGLTLAEGKDIRPGTPIYVFGSPFGLEGTITPGLASGERAIDGRSYIQVSAPISAGSSGGPVTDEQGAVLGIIVASLEVAQNINFAIPASVIAELPDVDMQPVQLAEERSDVSTAPVVEAPSQPERRIVTAGTAAFRGNTFGSPCNDVVLAEYQRKKPIGGNPRNVRFNKAYSGKLQFDVDLLGTPATVFYACDARFGMTEGYYQIRGHAEGVDSIARILRSKYGGGIASTISEADARDRGCMFNSSLPGSRYYRPSELQSLRIDDRFHIDLIVCGGRSTTTLLYYRDPALIASAGAVTRVSALPGRPAYKEGDL